MPFIPIPSSLELLNELGLPDLYKGSEIFLNKRANAHLIRREYWEGRELYTDISLYISGNRYRIEKRERTRFRGSPPGEFRVLSDHSLSNHQASLIKKHAKSSLALLFKDSPERSFKVVVVDKTKPIQPRSLAKLSSILNRFSEILDKPQCYSTTMDLFIPGLMSKEEADLFHEHIRNSGGRGISKVAILVFELGYERYRFRTSTCLKG